jgi:hypothetical protein
MAESVRFDNVIKLGKQLVAELGLNQSVDTLSRWMAHHISELIHSSETASEEGRDEIRSRCASAILELWQHHDALPNGRRPFQDFEPILRALESLDPDNTIPRYYRNVRLAAAEEEQNSESANWLDLADGLDYTARILIRFCLACAAQDAVHKSKEWVALAETVDATNDYLPVIRIVSYEAKLASDETATDEERKEIESRINRLEGFVNMAEMLTNHLREKLEAIDKIKEKSIGEMNLSNNSP